MQKWEGRGPRNRGGDRGGRGGGGGRGRNKAGGRAGGWEMNAKGGPFGLIRWRVPELTVNPDPQYAWACGLGGLPT